MKRMQGKIWIGAACFAAAMITQHSQAGEGGGFRFPIGLTYVQGAYDVTDKLKENFRISDDFVWPVGLSFSPYYEFNWGLGVGVDVGPAAIIDIQRFGASDNLNYIVPVGAHVRYTLLRDKDFSPYARAGFRYPIVGGDFLKDGSPGAFGAVGVEFLSTKRVSLAVELGYDTSTVKVIRGPLGGEKNATYGGLTASLMVVF